MFYFTLDLSLLFRVGIAVSRQDDLVALSVPGKALLVLDSLKQFPCSAEPQEGRCCALHPFVHLGVPWGEMALHLGLLRSPIPPSLLLG